MMRLRTSLQRAFAFSLLAFCLAFCLALCQSSPVYAQANADVALFQETLSSDFFGVDSRALALGNTGVISARDGAALIYNPANLARVRRIEFRGGLSHLRLENNTRFLSRDEETLTAGQDMRKTRINALSLTLPVPTYRGSLVAAFGVHRVNSFDRAFEASGYPDSALFPSYLRARGLDIEDGGLWKWSAGVAVDISPRLSTGLSLHLLKGKDRYGSQLFVTNGIAIDSITEEREIEIDYLGVSATVGLAYQASSVLEIGAVIETPTYLDAEEFFQGAIDTAQYDRAWDFLYEGENPYTYYTLIRPFSFGLGLQGNFERLILIGDVHYTDWSQLDIDYDDPILNEGPDRQFILSNLKEAVSLHIGAEYLFPEQGVRLRAGYFRDPLPIDGSFIEKERQYFTLGGGFLLDRVMTVDLAYVYGGYELRDTDPGRFLADYQTRRFFITLAYRI